MASSFHYSPASFCREQHSSGTSISAFFSSPKRWCGSQNFSKKVTSLFPPSPAATATPIIHLTSPTGGISSVSKATANLSPLLPTRETAVDREDPISLLHERIRREHGKGDSPQRSTMDPKEADKYIQQVKEQQQRGLQKLKGDSFKDGVFSYKVDPYTLRSGDYVVHKKVGIGRFVGIKFDVPRDSSEPIEYVFIEYADGMAKLPVKKASRILYRYNLYGYPRHCFLPCFDAFYVLINNTSI